MPLCTGALHIVLITIDAVHCVPVCAGVAALVLNGAVLVTMACRQRSTTGPEIYVLHLCVVEVAQVLLAFPVVISSSFSHKQHLGIKGQGSNGLLNPPAWLRVARVK